MLVHWVLIVFIHSAADVVASTKMNILPLDYGAVFPSREACESWGEDRILDEEIVESFICLPRPAYRNWSFERIVNRRCLQGFGNSQLVHGIGQRKLTNLMVFMHSVVASEVESDGWIFAWIVTIWLIIFASTWLRHLLPVSMPCLGRRLWHN